MSKLLMFYKATLSGDYPKYTDTIKTDKIDFEHPVSRRISYGMSNDTHIQINDNDDVRAHMTINGKEYTSSMSIYNFYLQLEGDDGKMMNVVPATRKQVMACLPRIIQKEARVVLNPSDMSDNSSVTPITAGMFEIDNPDLLTAEGYINIFDMGGVIKYRPHHGSLDESMSEQKIFSTVDEMFDHIVSEWTKDFNKELFTKDDIIISSNGIRDRRTDWKLTRYVCVKRLGDKLYTDTPQCIGMCSFE